MKIKEVSEKTELTERAIRLYIENGLVFPAFNESYSGRRNVDFSENDVELLKNISVLRKAGFSISDIKLMQLQPEKSKDILYQHIMKINERISADTEIVVCLSPLLAEDSINYEKICRSLDKPSVNEMSTPAEDNEISVLHKFMRRIFLIFGICGFIFSVLCLNPILSVEIRDIKRYHFPYYDLDANEILLMLFVFLSFVLPAFIILLNKKNEVLVKKKQTVKAVITVVFAVLYTVSIFFTSSLAFLASIAHPESYVISKTCDVQNYMIFDDMAARNAMVEFLPKTLSSASNIKYTYCYKHSELSHEPSRTRISLEFSLSEENFKKTVEYYMAFCPADSMSAPYSENKNDWIILFYRCTNEKAPSNYEPIFAYNEKKNAVRFICEYGQVYLKGTKNSIADFNW